jgi:hypothetical protein
MHAEDQAVISFQLKAIACVIKLMLVCDDSSPRMRRKALGYPHLSSARQSATASVEKIFLLAPGTFRRGTMLVNFTLISAEAPKRATGAITVERFLDAMSRSSGGRKNYHTLAASHRLASSPCAAWRYWAYSHPRRGAPFYLPSCHLTRRKQ